MKKFEHCGKSDLIRYIKKYFGTIIAFNKITGRNYANLYSWRGKKFVSRKLMMEVYIDIIKYKDQAESQYITEELKSEIRAKIYGNHKNVTAFCREHPEFKEQWISNLLNGHFKSIKKRARLLIKVLQIKNK